MTSSGTFNFAPSNGEIVLSAYERIQIHSPQIRTEHMFTARREANFMFAEWSNKGVNLWEQVLNQIPLVQGTNTYPIPGNVIMILDAYRSINTGTGLQTNIYMTPISRTEFASYPMPQIEAPPIVYWFDRLIAPTITLYPTPDDNGPYVFNYYAYTQIQDVNLSGGETPNVPYRFNDAMVAGMSHRLSRVYAPQMEALRKVDAKEAWDTAATQDTENVNMTIAPSLSGYYRR